MERQAYPYCPHGRYVGGCGADYMCGACEMGDEPPTIRELTQHVAYLLDKFTQEDAKLRTALDEHYGANIYSKAFIHAHFTAKNGTLQAISDVRRQIEYIGPLVKDVDDRGWLMREHYRRIKEWDKMDGEDQFWSLPAEVLDGP